MRSRWSNRLFRPCRRFDCGSTDRLRASVVFFGITRKRSMAGITFRRSGKKSVTASVKGGERGQLFSCMEIARLKDSREVSAVISAYLYGISRVQIGGGRSAGMARWEHGQRKG